MKTKKLSNYGLLAGSIGIMGGIAQQADAIIVHVSPNISSSFYGTISFDFDTGNAISSYNTSYDFRFGSSFFGNFNVNETSNTALTSGQTVDGNLTFTSNQGATVVGTSGNDYLGVELIRSGNTHYGWVRVKRESGIVTVFEFAWDNSAGATLTAGQTTAVPEPAHTVFALAAGAAGLTALRKRRKAKKSV